MPVIKDAEIPNHEFVKPKPIPRTDHTENVLLSSPPLCKDTGVVSSKFFSESETNTESATSGDFSFSWELRMEVIAESGTNKRCGFHRHI